MNKLYFKTKQEQEQEQEQEVIKGYNHNFHYVVGFYEESDFDLALYEIYIINTLNPR
ncbi:MULTISPECIES: hypothetical protein [Bacillus]|uniref:hypothetical protein n=1 Tax=Bacillus TaxID=1386 RepID=UPI0012B69008|nr:MULTISPECIES: hypothetical protein [Bacillus]